MKIDRNLKEEIDGVVHYRVINPDGTLGGLVDEFTYDEHNNRMIFIVDDGTYISKESVVTNSIIKTSSIRDSVVKNSDLCNSVINSGSTIIDSKLSNCTVSRSEINKSDLKSCLVKNKSNLLNVNVYNKEFKIANVSNLNQSGLPSYRRNYNIRPIDFVNITASLNDRGVYWNPDIKITDTKIIHQNGLVVNFEKALDSVSGLKEITKQLSVVTDSNITLNWEDRSLYKQLAELVILRRHNISYTKLKIISSRVLDSSLYSTISVSYDMYKNNNYCGKFMECVEVMG